MQPTFATPAGRYDRVAVALHWFLGLWLLGQIGFGWALGQIARNTPERALAINLHKSSGLLLALFIVLRLAWRLRHAAPAYPASMNALQQRIARAGHALLYVCMIGLPLSGYLAANFSKHGVNFLNVYALPPWGPDDKALYAVFHNTHDALALAFTVLVAGHVLIGLQHALIARDGLFERMTLRGGARR